MPWAAVRSGFLARGEHSRLALRFVAWKQNNPQGKPVVFANPACLVLQFVRVSWLKEGIRTLLCSLEAERSTGHSCGIRWISDCRSAK